MGTNLSPVLHRVLENLDNGGHSHMSAMKALKSYVEDLDPRTIPIFLAQVSETKKLGSSSGECTIALYEVLARVHGPNILPHIDEIMSTIVDTLLSSPGSFALHQACSSVVPTIARYGIDPLMPENEKTRIIRSLAKPLSDVLMGLKDSAASGAALCLKGLVESDNWRFASNDMVNEVCLKVAGALEEKQTQTNSHMELVMSLMKHNGLIAEPYARSLIRSGLRILTAVDKESESDKQLNAILMINFLMQGVDSRSISSEIFKVVDVMEKCENDNMRTVRVAASEALQTAKMLAGQKVPRDETCSSPIAYSKFYRRNNMIDSLESRDNADAWGPGSPTEIPSPESQTVDSFVDYDTSAVSPMSMGQYNFECVKHANRRSWNNDNSKVDTTLKDGFFHKARLSGDDSIKNFGQFRCGEMSEVHNERPESSSGFVQPSAMNVVLQATTPSPQRSRPQLSADERSRTQPGIDNVKISSTPQKNVRSIRNPFDVNSESLERQPARVPASLMLGNGEFNMTTAHGGDYYSQNLNSELNVRKNIASMRKMTKQKNTQEDAQPAIDIIRSASSTLEIPKHSACESFCRVICEGENEACSANTKRRCGKAALGIVCCLSMIIFAIILSGRSSGNNEGFFDIVPT